MVNIDSFAEIEDCIRWYPCSMHPIDEHLVFGEPSLNLYIHIPFCKHRCLFCPFNKYQFQEDIVNQYLNALTNEMKLTKKLMTEKSFHLRTIWIGGGTPMDLSLPQLSRLFKCVRAFNPNFNDEYTVEGVAGPTVTAEKLRLLKKFKINRISLGVQTFQDDYLQKLGRSHTSIQAKQAIRLVQQMGYKLNVDLMFRLPGQTLSEFKKDVVATISLHPGHLSCYPFFPVKNTPIYQLMKKRGYEQASKEEYFNMYSYMIRTLNAAGYVEYTPYHFSKKNQECSYLKDRWFFPQKQTLAFGAGAVSFFNKVVYTNIHNVHTYISTCNKNKLPILEGKKVRYAEEITRNIALGLNELSLDLNKISIETGISYGLQYAKQIATLKKYGLIEKKESLQLTLLGKAFFPEVMQMFFTSKDKQFAHPKGVDYIEKK